MLAVPTRLEDGVAIFALIRAPARDLRVAAADVRLRLSEIEKRAPKLSKK